MNKQRLEKLMKRYGENGKVLAQHIGISRQRFSSKLNEKKGAEFTQIEIRKICKHYGLGAEDVNQIFFNVSE
ncbi:hypothetical protein FACS189418_8560 [Clostridia bacterium]|nr:hypothetical protein FACS189418_8560 [Clostridia bacterium]